MAKEDLKTVYIRGVSPQLNEELNNIAKHLGITLTSMLKPKLREIADTYPSHYKQPLKD